MTDYPITRVEQQGEAVARLVDFPCTVAYYADERSVQSQLHHQFTLIVAERMAEGRRIPEPSAASGERLVLGQMDATKIALYHLFLDSGMTRFELAKRMRIEAREVYRLFDLRQPVSVTRLERAAAALGRRVVISLVEQK